MNRTDFYRGFAAEYDTKIGEAKTICLAVFDYLSQCINENDRVYIKGLGTFKKKKTKAHRVGSFANAGETIVIPPQEKIIFEPFNGKDDADDADEN